MRAHSGNNGGDSDSASDGHGHKIIPKKGDEIIKTSRKEKQSNLIKMVHAFLISKYFLSRNQHSSILWTWSGFVYVPFSLHSVVFALLHAY